MKRSQEPRQSRSTLRHVSDEPKLRRAWLRGYKRGDVDLAVARATIAHEQVQHELEGTKARANAMHAEIKDLHGRLDDVRQREQTMARTLDEIRQRREQLEQEAAARARSIVDEAEQRAAALRTDGLRAVLRAGLSAALKRVTQDITDSLDRLAAAPARAVEQTPPPTQPASEPDPRFARWSDESES
jgi:chromosome segregation ATPase